MLHNYRYGQDWGKLFELGSVFSKTSIDNYNEKYLLSMLSFGEEHSLYSSKSKSDKNIFKLKGDVESLLKDLSIKNWIWKYPKSENYFSFLHPGQSIGLFVEGKLLGFIGSLHPQLLQDYKVRVPVVVAELDYETLIRRQPRVVQSVTPSRFPVVWRDVALKVPETVKNEEILSLVRKSSGTILKDVYLFDVFNGETVEAGFNSQSYLLVYQSKDKTLEEVEVNQSFDKMLNQLQTKLKLEIR
jgi:phenylalanyl-tRNA synthetase beta chain